MTTPPVTTLRPWNARNRLSAAHLQESPDAINALLMALASTQDDGTSPIRTECWPGVISATGPNREADFTDERYWVARAFVKGAAPNDQVSIQQEVTQSQSPSGPPSGVGFDQNPSNIFCVTNLPEVKTHSHTLSPGTPVWVWAWWDSGLTSIPATTVPGTAGNPPPGSPRDNQKHYFTSVYLSQGVIFRVNLTKTSGSTGTQSSAASWVYTAKTLDNVTTLGTGLSPEKSRPNGNRTQATIGTGYYNNSGVFVLYEADEPFGTGSC
jgi:hypothetical protein